MPIDRNGYRDRQAEEYIRTCVCGNQPGICTDRSQAHRQDNGEHQGRRIRTHATASEPYTAPDLPFTLPGIPR
jgi:hypothetical protein